ncbi:alpha/beta hydrolase domain-containing protein [Microvirga calopogonii]|uniref:alpha/beta hydrolase domain-containing protein n=1 Tax=Microvirga calopogonii TaxID=2078013 RepID=UPI000E0D6157|nr:alpha/beta hydrolase domain-containing protein [Microvirga calopogonii]
MQSRSALSIVATAVLGLAPVVPAPAVAEISKVTVNSTQDIGPFHGKSYRQVEATLEGKASGGEYSVPVTMAFPTNPADASGVAVVDVVNTVTIGKEQWVIGGRVLPVARIHMGDDFLFGAGRSYIAPLWDKTAVEALKTGSIAAPADGYTIIADAAELARNAAKYMPDGPPAATTTIAYGFSQSGSVLRGWHADRYNTRSGRPVFEGSILGGDGGACRDLVAQKRKACPGVVADGGKVMVFATETDVETGGFADRGEGSDYRVIEVAGVSHIPASAADFRQHGLPEQNPVDFGPALRAALVNMEGWIKGAEPPANALIELSDDSARNVQGMPFREAKRDADGNALGGLRLPHLPTTLANGEHVGAPVGSYNGLAWKHENGNFFFLISGSFESFPATKLQTLYPSQEAYVRSVAAAADELVRLRQILPEDAQAYVQTAQAKGLTR